MSRSERPLALYRFGSGQVEPPCALPAVDRSRSHGATASLEIRSAHDSGAAAEATADLLLARCESDLSLICELFGISWPVGQRIQVVLTPMPTGLPAMHAGTVVHCDFDPGAAGSARPALYSCYLLATQLVEIVAGVHAADWSGAGAAGEALSRVLAGNLYPRWAAGFSCAAAFLDSPRADGISRAGAGDDDPVAIGCAALFLNYLHHELDIDWATIIRAGGPALAITHHRVTGSFTDPFPAFRDALARARPFGATNRASDDNPFPVTAAIDPATDMASDSSAVLAPAGAGPAAAVLSRPVQPALADILAHRRWWTVDAPLRHVRAENVLTQPSYDALVATFRARKQRGELTRSLPGYDASAAAVTQANAGAFGLFLTREWHDLIAGLFGIAATGDVIATLHHHASGSAPGTIHNDLNPGWFPRHGPEQVCVHDPAANSYRTGQSSDGASTVEHVRAISLLYYFDTPADVQGGGTGFYRSARQSVAEPDVVVEPKNNSLVAFECTPFSFHTFLSNAGRERNCLAMWLHRERAAVVEQWGAGSIVGWH